MTAVFPNPVSVSDIFFQPHLSYAERTSWKLYQVECPRRTLVPIFGKAFPPEIQEYICCSKLRRSQTLCCLLARPSPNLILAQINFLSFGCEPVRESKTADDCSSISPERGFFGFQIMIIDATNEYVASSQRQSDFPCCYRAQGYVLAGNDEIVRNPRGAVISRPKETRFWVKYLIQ
jgi:hypothetical protein